jgi:hypothetical protein
MRSHASDDSDLVVNSFSCNFGVINLDVSEQTFRILAFTPLAYCKNMTGKLKSRKAIIMSTVLSQKG